MKTDLHVVTVPKATVHHGDLSIFQANLLTAWSWWRKLKERRTAYSGRERTDHEQNQAFSSTTTYATNNQQCRLTYSRTHLDLNNAANVVPSYAPCLSSRSLQHSLRRDKFTIHSKAVVCQDVELKGDITIGSGEQTPIYSPNFSLYRIPFFLAGTIVHPKATIFAIAGPIVIGTGCIIEEGAIIVNRLVLLLSQDERVADMGSGGERSCE